VTEIELTTYFVVYVHVWITISIFSIQWLQILFFPSKVKDSLYMGQNPSFWTSISNKISSNFVLQYRHGFSLMSNS